MLDNISAMEKVQVEQGKGVEETGWRKGNMCY